TIEAAPTQVVSGAVGAGVAPGPGVAVGTVASSVAPGARLGAGLSSIWGIELKSGALATAAAYRRFASTSCAPPRSDSATMPTAANRNVGPSGWNDGANRSRSSIRTLLSDASRSVAAMIVMSATGVIGPIA